jgi:DNA-binding transcriptional LysR family regulator
MDRLRLIESFLRVAQTGSFSLAAEQLGLSRAAVTKQIQDLEAQLGARLLNRTSRRVSPTTVGEIYISRCTGILADLNEADAAVRHFQDELAGPLRVLVPHSFGSHHFAGAVTRFAAKYPSVAVDVVFSDSGAHAFGASSDFDVAVRLWSMPEDSATIAHHVGSLKWVLCAAPGYLASQPAVTSPDDLRRLNCLIHPRLAPDRIWRFTDGAQVKVSGTFTANSVLALRRAVIDGLGIAMLPLYYVQDEVQSGAVTVLLGDNPPPSRPVHIVLPMGQYVPLRVRRFTRYLRAWFVRAGWHAAPGEDQPRRAPSKPDV